MNTLTWKDVPLEHRRKVAAWVRGATHDMKVDQESVTAEQGFDLVAAIDALADHIAPLPPREKS